MGAGDGHNECMAAAKRVSAIQLKAPEEYRTVIHIFAAMAIKTSHQGATS